MTLRPLLSRVVRVGMVGTRSMFTASKPDTVNPNWLRVGLAFGTSALLWGMVSIIHPYVFVLWGMLFKQHSTDVHEYKVRNGLD